MPEEDSIQTLKGFPRKFSISEDYTKINWATLTDVERVGEVVAQQIAEIRAAVSNIHHNSLIGISVSDHHNKIHAETHAGNGSDPLGLPLELKSGGTRFFRFDTSGNLIIKGRYLTE